MVQYNVKEVGELRTPRVIYISLMCGATQHIPETVLLGFIIIILGGDNNMIYG